MGTCRIPMLLAVAALAIAPPLHAHTNVLLVVADDVSPEILGVYGEGPDPAPTPTLDALAARGARFTRCWSAPICSPTRATILTGRHGFRTGIGHLVGANDPTLDPSEVTLAEALRSSAAPQPYATACIGKWHLGAGGHGPAAAGFAGFTGNVEGLAKSPNQGYYLWQRYQGGVPAMSTEYNTTSVVDDALEFIGHAPEPWFAYVAMNAGHYPFDPPPSGLHTQDLNKPPQARSHYRAVVEAMDHELGRLLARLPSDVRSRTLVVFVGDNGVPGDVAVPPIQPWKAKGTLYEGGVRVPLIVSGAGVSGPGVCDALVHTVDLFPTVLAAAGVPLGAVLPPGRKIDGRDLLPILQGPPAPDPHEVVFTEAFLPNGDPFLLRADAVRDERYKAIWWPDHVELFDLHADPWETTNLLLPTPAPGALAALERLTRARAELMSPDLPAAAKK